MALLAFVVGVLNLLVQYWRVWLNAAVTTGLRWPMIPLFVGALLFDSVMPLFDLALYRDRDALHLTNRLRLLSLLASTVPGYFLVVAIRAEWLNGFLWNAATMIRLLSEFANAASFLLLVMFVFHRDGQSDQETGSSEFLHTVVKIAVIVLGLATAWNLFRLAISPWLYSTLKTAALANGHAMPPFSTLVYEILQPMVPITAVFAPACVVFLARSLSFRTNVEEPPVPALE